MADRTIGEGAFSNNPSLNLVDMSTLTGNITFPTTGTGVFENSGVLNGSGNRVFTVTLDNTLLTINNTTTYANFFPANTTINQLCLLEGTLILTPSGYKPVETLKKGDLIRTLDGDKPMSYLLTQTIHHDASVERNQKQLFSMNYPSVFQPLIMTGAHSTLVTPTPKQTEWIQSMPDFREPVYGFYRFPAVLDEHASIYEVSGDYTVYNIMIGRTFEGIFANGLLVESCVVY